MKNKNLLSSKCLGKKSIFCGVNKSNLIILLLMSVVIISSIILTSFSAFSSIDEGKNKISISADIPDTIPPTCGSIVGESSTWTKDTRQISVTCNDNRGCEKGVYITTFDKTTKTTSVTIKDKAGNSTNCPVNVYVDKTAPSCGSVTGGSTSWTKDNRTVSVACSDSDSTCSKISFSNTFSSSVAANGVGYITISDVAGNTTSCPVNAYVDKTAPSCGTVTGASTTWTKDNRTISVACSDTNSKCSKTSFSNTYSTTTTTANITISDNVGNTTTCPVNVYVDKTAPTCGTITGASTTWTKDNRTISVACSDTNSKCSKTSFSNTYSTTTQTANITISDNVGNTATCPVNVYVDKTPPTCGTITGASTTWTTSDRTISVACSDAHSKCVSSSYSKTYSSYTKTDSIIISDVAGNTKSCPVNVYVGQKLSTAILGKNNVNIVTSGSGLYKTTETNNGSPSYYYKGNVTNNYFKLSEKTGDALYRIVRINEDGSIRLIRNQGIYSNTGYSFVAECKYAYQKFSECNYSEEDLLDTSCVYACMYYSNTNVKEGIMKTVNDWYVSAIEGMAIENKIVNSAFCEQAKIKADSFYDNYKNAIMQVASKDYNPSLKCSVDGNQKGNLSMKVGLITMDEVLFAGIPLYYSGITSSQYNKNTYLNMGSGSWYFWTMTPAGAELMSAYIYNVNEKGYINDSNESYKNPVIRPVVSLSSDIQISGLGTSSDPYVPIL